MPVKRLLLTPLATRHHPYEKLLDGSGAGGLKRPAGGVGYLATRDEDGKRSALWVGENKSVLVGRDVTTCQYVVEGPTISKNHMRFYVTKTDRNVPLVCVEDLSTNGIVVNGRLLVGRSAILLEGDTVALRGVHQDFTLRLPPKDAPPPVISFTPSHLDSPTLKLGAYTVNTSVVLGSGSFGVVRLGRHPVKGQVAVKSVVKNRIRTQEDLRRFRNEITLGSQLAHPNLNRVHGALDDGEHYHVFLQLVTGGDLFTYIEGFTLRGKKMGEAECKFLTFQILQGVKYLHSMGVAHRDIKPENVVLRQAGPYPTVQLCDFGLSTSFDPALLHSHSQRAGPRIVRAPSILGTPLYFSPEYIVARRKAELERSRAGGGARGEEREMLDATGLDMWAAGVVAWICMTGNHPFGNDDGDPTPSQDGWATDDSSDEYAFEYDGGGGGLWDESRGASLDQVIIKRAFDRRVLLDEKCPTSQLGRYDMSAGQFLQALLHPDPAERATVTEALDLEWMTLEPDRSILEKAWEERVGR